MALIVNPHHQFCYDTFELEREKSGPMRSSSQNSI